MRTALLTFVLVAGALTLPVRAQTGPDLAGTWLGTLDVGAKLRLVFHVQAGEASTWTATMDSPDQGANGIPVSAVVVSGLDVRFEVAVAGAAYAGTFDAETGRITGSWLQGGMTLPLVLERTAGVEPPKRPQEPKAPFPYRAEDVRFENAEAGIMLAGTFTVPPGAGPFPAVVLVTGSGPQNRDEELLGHKPFAVLADHLTRWGIAVLRYDDRGIGASGGNFATATTEDFAGDALAAVAFLRSRPEVAGARIGIAGHSEGGIVAPMAAVRSNEVAFLVLLAGTGLRGEEIIYLQSALIGRAEGGEEQAIEKNLARQKAYFDVVASEPDPAKAAGTLKTMMDADLAAMTDAEKASAGLTGTNTDVLIASQIEQLNSPWFRYFLSYDPLPALSRVRVPVLALNGTLDLQVPYRENLAAIEKALRDGGNDDVTIVALEGLNHLFQTARTGSPTEYASIEETMAPRALETISNWIVEKTR